MRDSLYKLCQENKDAYGPVKQKRPCWICARTGISISHRHASSMEAYRYMKSKGLKQLFCNVCKFRHSRRLNNRIRILASTSTLHDAQEGNYKADSHYDVVTVCGGKIKDLKKQFFEDYKDVEIPVDVVCLAGLNDVKHTDVADFKEDMKEWVRFIKDLALKNNTKSSLVLEGVSSGGVLRI